MRATVADNGKEECQGFHRDRIEFVCMGITGAETWLLFREEHQLGCDGNESVASEIWRLRSSLQIEVLPIKTGAE